MWCVAGRGVHCNKEKLKKSTPHGANKTKIHRKDGRERKRSIFIIYFVNSIYSNARCTNHFTVITTNFCLVTASVHLHLILKAVLVFCFQNRQTHHKAGTQGGTKDPLQTTLVHTPDSRTIFLLLAAAENLVRTENSETFSPSISV